MVIYLKKKPYFNFPGKTPATHCKGMINVNKKKQQQQAQQQELNQLAESLEIIDNDIKPRTKNDKDHHNGEKYIFYATLHGTKESIISY